MPGAAPISPLRWPLASWRKPAASAESAPWRPSRDAGGVRRRPPRGRRFRGRSRSITGIAAETAVLRPFLILALGQHIGACAQYASTAHRSMAASEARPAEEMPRPEAASIHGWGPFTFGMNFDDAVTAHPGVVWEAASLGRCRAEMPLVGCTLRSAAGSRVPPTAGVALLPSVTFNRQGQLAAIRLSMFVRANMAPARCERAYGQLLDGLYDTWSAPTEYRWRGRGTLRRSTPKGREFLLGLEERAIVGRETFHVQPDGRQIILRFGYIGATDPDPATCELSVHYRGPEGLQPPTEERRHLYKNWY